MELEEFEQLVSGVIIGNCKWILDIWTAEIDSFIDLLELREVLPWMIPSKVFVSGRSCCALPYLKN